MTKLLFKSEIHPEKLITKAKVRPDKDQSFSQLLDRFCLIHSLFHWLNKSLLRAGDVLCFSPIFLFLVLVRLVLYSLSNTSILYELVHTFSFSHKKRERLMWFAGHYLPPFEMYCPFRIEILLHKPFFRCIDSFTLKFFYKITFLMHPVSPPISWGVGGC